MAHESKTRRKVNMKTYQKLLLIILVLLLALGAVPFAAMPAYAEAKETPTVRLESDTTELSQNLLRIKVHLDGDKICGISGEWSYSDNLTLLKEESINGWTLEQNGDVFCLYGTTPLEADTDVLQLTFFVDFFASSKVDVSACLQSIKISNGEGDIDVATVQWSDTVGKDGGGGGDTASGGCYVATAVYGSYDCPQVWTLRRYRDNTLAKTWYGRAFIHTYYAISPTLVEWFGDTDWFKNMWRKPLDRMVERLNDVGVANTPYQDLDW